MIKFNSRTVLLSGALAAFGLSGCALTDTEAKQAMDIVDSPTALNTPQAEWGTPFWERGNRAGSADDGKTAPSFTRRDAPLANVAIALDDGLDATLPRALTAGAAEHGMLVLPKGLVQDALNNTPGCDDLASEACRSALSVYPGARLVVRIDAASGGQASVRVWDTALNKELEERVANDDQGAARLLESLGNQVAAAEWSARPFVGEGDDLYIAAGRVNGLAEGTELEVREPGRAVRSPTGQVVAWRAGQVVGKARVAEWVGATLSRVESVSGTALSPKHRLSLAP
ncbi:hypothetical protein [Alloalcanivorax gelatiniphagus]|uniref:Lipoprotein n=1 Tax=Alloalcanivorax gelatiniphagus TaxID=1194167 RepID=A0ABY2XJP4_9GAMM|nr:hypothetical protein [Alloalcanivorax gelatiniphagus]TMW11332.1 hypothetical protein FGS76_14840 [Alloalcanivorax gelatiniphagus]|tara:strand:+ start:3893 stop:4750 length:858 start_codon:yes stop_codon:yes gene_type:complete